jgi:hypothetical protein
MSDQEKKEETTTIITPQPDAKDKRQDGDELSEEELKEVAAGCTGNHIPK